MTAPIAFDFFIGAAIFYFQENKK